MNKLDWVHLDIDSLEQLEVSEAEKIRVKAYVLQSRKRPSRKWSNIAMISALITGIMIVTGFAFPTISAQIPIVHSVISYIKDDLNRFSKFEEFSNDIGFVRSSNGITITIDKAIYDGRNITASYLVETEEHYDSMLVPSSLNWFSVNGASMNIGGESRSMINDTQYRGFFNFIPVFSNGEFPETVHVTINPDYFYNSTVKVEGDWLIELSLTSIDNGDIRIINEATTHPQVKFVIKSLEFTGVSTIMDYDQIATPELLDNWGTVFPVFHISDDLGQVYMDGIEQFGGGITVKQEVLHSGTTTFGAIDKRASKLIIQPIAMKSIHNSNKESTIELEPIVIDISRSSYSISQ